MKGATCHLSVVSLTSAQQCTGTSRCSCCFRSNHEQLPARLPTPRLPTPTSIPCFLLPTSTYCLPPNRLPLLSPSQSTLSPCLVTSLPTPTNLSQPIPSDCLQLYFLPPYRYCLPFYCLSNLCLASQPLSLPHPPTHTSFSHRSLSP